jgi:hypothetical protein
MADLDFPLARPVYAGLQVPPYDHEAHTYSGSNPVSTIYRLGGPGGEVVATVTRTFDGAGNLLTQWVAL